MDLVVSCEHASCAVPPGLEEALGIPEDVLQSHRGWDPGAAWTAEQLAAEFETELFLGQVTRLAVDLNRSADNRRADSVFAQRLPVAQRQALRQRYHAPHWDAVGRALARLTRRGPVLHLSVHSFTPVLHGKHRPMDIGLLYDPVRRLEAALARELKGSLSAAGLNVARNAPYRGRDDGITRGMRARFGPEAYAGIELELNQARVRDGRLEPEVYDAVRAALATILGVALHPRGTPGAPTAQRPGA